MEILVTAITVIYKDKFSYNYLMNTDIYGGKYNHEELENNVISEFTGDENWARVLSITEIMLDISYLNEDVIAQYINWISSTRTTVNIYKITYHENFRPPCTGADKGPQKTCYIMERTIENAKNVFYNLMGYYEIDDIYLSTDKIPAESTCINFINTEDNIEK